MIEILNKFGRIFDKKQKCRILIIVLMMIMGAFLETLGVSLIVPLITTILDDNFFHTNSIVKTISNMVGISSAKTFIIAMLTVLMLIFIIKAAFLYLEYYVQQRFICNYRMRVQRKLMKSFLHRPYDYFLYESTGNIQRVIIEDVNRTFDLLNNLMTLFTELSVCIVVLAAIIMVDAVIAIFVCIVLLAEILIIAKKVKPTMIRLGNDARTANGQTNKWIIQAMEGIKEIKITGKQEFFIERYTDCATKNAQILRKSQLIMSVPRLVIEAVTISAMLGLMVVLLLAGRNVADLLPQLSAFAVAAVRLLPSANRISVSMNNLHLWEPNLDALVSNLDYIKKWEQEKDQEDDNINQPIIELSLEKNCMLSDVTFAYNGTNQKILEHADMVVPVGKSIGVVGTSGAGKTTAVDILLGLLSPQGGAVLADGRNIKENYTWWIKHLSYIPQTIYMLDDTVAANVAFGNYTDKIDEEAVKKALRDVQMEEFIQSLPDGIYSVIGERGMRLSGGQRQRIGIARALYNNPELIVFDEATSALDNDTEAAIMESISALHGKKTMIIIAHRLSTIEECDFVYRVENRKIIRER